VRNLAIALTFLAAAQARADLVDLKFGGLISSDIRFRPGGEEIDSPYPSQYRLMPGGFSRNENVIKAKLSATVGSKVKAVADVDLVLYGYSDVKDIDAATLRERVDPYRFEAHAAYVDIYQVLPNLDLRIGRQVVQWGAADQFNPTNNLNTLDLSDPLLFGRALANNMVRVDWNPKSDWILTAVWVPIFRPAELPRSAPLALRQVDRPPPIQEDASREILQLFAPSRFNRIDVTALQPDVTLANSQVGLRLGGRLLNQDISLSYYHGRFGIPTPVATVNHMATGIAEVAVAWPRMDVIGADIAGSIGPLHGLGYWAEGAVVFPQQVDYALYNDSGAGPLQEVRLSGQQIFLNTVNDAGAFCAKGQTTGCGPYAKAPQGSRGTVISSQPFPKVTIGADLSLGSHLYANVQYLHGFIDEFGSGKAFHTRRDPTDKNEFPRTEQRMGDYLVAGIDAKLFSDVLLLRLFGVVKLPSFDWDGGGWEGANGVYKPTGVVFPQAVWTVWDGTELSLGAFIFLGDRDTKFGDPSAGASEIFTKAKFTF
jgi:Protein of unknown function (DUF1302)